MELSELFDEIVQVTKIIQGSIQKFKQLDIDGSGTLEGGEVNLLADWILTEMESNETSPTGHDRNVLKDKIFARFNKGEKDTITLGEMALLNEELMVLFTLHLSCCNL